MNASPLTVARALHAALEAGQHGDALRPLFTDDAATTEHPNLIKPAGAVTPLDAMIANSRAGAGLLATQRFELRSAIEVGSTAIVRLRWTGEIARDVGPFRKGQVLTAHVAQFIETRDGKIASIETFDCYEPFTAA